MFGGISAVWQNNPLMRAWQGWSNRRRVLSAAHRGDYGPLLLRAEQAMNDSLWHNGPDHPETARLMAALAAVYGMQGEAGEAVPLLRRALAILEHDGASTEERARLYEELSDLHRQEKQFDEADVARTQALTLRELLVGTSHPSVAIALDELGLVRRARGLLNEAKALHHRALGIYETTCGPGTPEMARCLTHLASLYIEASEFNEAEPLLARAVDVWKSSHNPDDLYAIITLSCYGDLYRRTGRAAEALGMEREAKAVMAKYVK